MRTIHHGAAVVFAATLVATVGNPGPAEAFFFLPMLLQQSQQQSQPSINSRDRSPGDNNRWRRSGGELYYRNGDSMMVVPIATAPSFKAGRPQELWKGHYSHGMSSSCGPPGTTSSNYDVTADGSRFLMIQDDDQDRALSRQVVAVLGWGDELAPLAAKA